MRAIAILLSLGLALPLAAAEVHALPSQRHGIEAPAVTLGLPAMDAAKLRAEALSVRKPGAPLQFAEPLAGKALRAAAGKALDGEWLTLADGSRLWRLEVHAPGAINLNFHFSKFRLPYGAELHIVAPDLKERLGPYTDADNTDFGEFWTPILDGERALIELWVPAEHGRLQFELGGIQRGFLDPFMTTVAKAGDCNIDVACPQGDPWRDQIRSVARYTFNTGSGTFLCTGQLMATTDPAQDRVFTTAHHCVSSASVASTVVLFWRYESPTCRPVGSAQNGQVIPLTGNSITQTGGATLLGAHADSDFTVLRLNTSPPVEAQVFPSGWDRRTTPSLAGGTALHHPQGHEKRIALTSQTLLRDDLPASGLGRFHWRVPFWEQGTTEQGSSGSGLWSADKRLIGVLSGGSASCGNPSGFDIYGRLETAWEGGGSSATRARDWLDPANTGLPFLDGGGCEAPTVSLDVLTPSPAAGQPVTLRATASGGAGGPYTYAWDVDGDGVTDREGPASEIAPLYARATSTQVRVRVTDGAGCSALATRALDVVGADLAVTPGNPAQLCGNGNAGLDPGERWRLPVTVRNDGGKAVSQAALLFQALGAGGASGGPDAFGYTFADQNDAGACGFAFIDISDGQRLGVTPSSTFPAEDDGRTAPIALAFPFDFYGENVTSLVMSTNGYLSTSSAESGGQWQVNCSGAQSQGSTGARIDPLQYDWLYDPAGGASRGLFHRHFPTCPRAPDVGPAGLACHVFQWNGMESFDGVPAGRHDFQAILYAQTHQIVFQYRSSDPNQGNGAHVTIQNAANTARLPYACRESGRIGPVRSVCYFHPSAARADTPPALRLENPAVSLPNLGAGQQTTIHLDFQVDPGAACGAPARIRYLGGAEAGAFSTQRAATVLDATIASGCQTLTSCPAQIQPIAMQQGLYANPARFGNGFGSFLVPVAGQDPMFFGAWLTALADRSPTWYIVQGPLRDNQVRAQIGRTRQVGSSPFTVSTEIVGEAHVVLTAPDWHWIWWSLPEGTGMEPVQILYSGARPAGHHTQAWFHPPEAGWGLVFDEHFLHGRHNLVVTSFLFGAGGEPRWSVGETDGIASGDIAQVAVRVHCPGCPSFADFGNFQEPAGTLIRSFSTRTSGLARPQVVWPGYIGGSFLRPQPLPIQPLAPPQ
jgi:lysyl endopeptidase